MLLSKVLNYLIIIFIGRFVVDLYLSNEISYLIHPKYILFTLISSVIAIGVGFIGLALNFKKNDDEQQRGGSLNSIFKMSLIFILIYLPNYQINPLSSITFSQRALDLNSLNIDQIQIGELSNFVRNTENIPFGDWVKAINVNPNLKEYEGKKVKLTGFVFKPDDSIEKMFMISRFVVTCCAVDARPVGIWVESIDSYDSDEWVEVNGKFEIKNISGVDMLVVKPSKINKIQVPDQPYIY